MIDSLRGALRFICAWPRKRRARSAQGAHRGSSRVAIIESSPTYSSGKVPWVRTARLSSSERLSWSAMSVGAVIAAGGGDGTISGLHCCAGRAHHRTGRCWNLGGCTEAASRELRDSGSISTETVPSRKGFFSFTATNPSAVNVTCSCAIGGLNTYLSRFSRPRSSSAPAHVAAWSENPASSTHNGRTILGPDRVGRVIFSGFRRSSGPAGGNPETAAAASCS